jgi:hypothetical protein
VSAEQAAKRAEAAAQAAAENIQLARDTEDRAVKIATDQVPSRTSVDTRLKKEEIENTRVITTGEMKKSEADLAEITAILGAQRAAQTAANNADQDAIRLSSEGVTAVNNMNAASRNQADANAKLNAIHQVVDQMTQLTGNSRKIADSELVKQQAILERVKEVEVASETALKEAKEGVRLTGIASQKASQTMEQGERTDALAQQTRQQTDSLAAREAQLRKDVGQTKAAVKVEYDDAKGALDEVKKETELAKEDRELTKRALEAGEVIEAYADRALEHARKTDKVAGFSIATAIKAGFDATDFLESAEKAAELAENTQKREQVVEKQTETIVLPGVDKSQQRNAVSRGNTDSSSSLAQSNANRAIAHSKQMTGVEEESLSLDRASKAHKTEQGRVGVILDETHGLDVNNVELEKQATAKDEEVSTKLVKAEKDLSTLDESAGLVDTAQVRTNGTLVSRAKELRQKGRDLMYAEDAINDVSETISAKVEEQRRHMKMITGLEETQRKEEHIALDLAATMHSQVPMIKQMSASQAANNELFDRVTETGKLQEKAIEALVDEDLKVAKMSRKANKELEAVNAGSDQVGAVHIVQLNDVQAAGKRAVEQRGSAEHAQHDEAGLSHQLTGMQVVDKGLKSEVDRIDAHEDDVDARIETVHNETATNVGLLSKAAALLSSAEDTAATWVSRLTGLDLGWKSTSEMQAALARDVKTSRLNAEDQGMEIHQLASKAVKQEQDGDDIEVTAGKAKERTEESASLNRENEVGVMELAKVQAQVLADKDRMSAGLGRSAKNLDSVKMALGRVQGNLDRVFSRSGELEEQALASETDADISKVDISGLEEKSQKESEGAAEPSWLDKLFR